MNPRSIRDYADTIHPHYLAASRSEKSRILAEFCRVTGYHRKSAIRLLHHAPPPRRRSPRAGASRTSSAPRPRRCARTSPLRTFGKWTDVRPGALQADLVPHCGEGAPRAGFYLSWLVTVDVATGWTSVGRSGAHGVTRVGSAVHQVRQRLPFTLRELHTDNGDELLNHVLVPWCRREASTTPALAPMRKTTRPQLCRARDHLGKEGDQSQPIASLLRQRSAHR